MAQDALALQLRKSTILSVPRALKLVGLAGGTLGALTIVMTVLAYLPGHPEFSPFATYLSDIGDTAGWGQILFNSGTLIGAPLRYLIVALLALRLLQLGASRAFAKTILIIGAFSTAGTVFMTAVPFSVAPTIHKSGIGLYFLGVVVLQTLIGLQEWRLKAVPRVLPGLGFLVVVIFAVFAALMLLYDAGAVAREAPVIWEWLCAFSSIVWVFAHSLLLGRDSSE